MSYQSSTYNPKKHTIYSPINEEKYIGKEYPICRSSWENVFCNWCDRNPNVVKWSSEAIQIPYYDPTKRKMRRYYPDFTMIILDKNGKENKYVIEIKPKSQTYPPIKKNKKSSSYLYEYVTYQINIAKWNATIMFCKKMGMNFKILTEDDLFKNGKPI